MIKIVGLGGSMSSTSSSLAALRLALDSAAAAGAETQLLDVRALDLPLFVPGASGPESVRLLCRASQECDAMIWSSPMYHGTISGSFKNALDWLELLGKQQPPYLKDKVIGLIACSGGAQAMQAINAMEHSVRALHAWTLPTVVAIGRSMKTIETEEVRRRLDVLGREIVRAVRRFSPQVGANEFRTQNAE